MSQQYRYSLPERRGDTRQLGQLTGSACAVECAEIIERHDGPVMLITPDMQTALRLRDEIQQFSPQPVSTLSDWETLPYDSFSPHQDIISARLSCLYHLPAMKRGVIILPINTLMQRVCPHEFLHGHALVMKKGQHLSRDKLRAQLEQAGYRSVEQVMEHGEFATRGALLDLYPMGSNEPYRIDFFDDDIDSLRVFDVDSQRTLVEVEQINLLPAHEFPIDKAAIELFRSQWREQFEVRRDNEHIYQQVSKGIWPAGIEYWQPLFFSQQLPTLFSYLPENTLLVNTGDLESSAERFWQDVNQRFESRRVDPMRPLLAPESLWLRVDALFNELKEWPRVQLKTEAQPAKAANTNLCYQPLPDLSVQAQQKAPLDNLRRFIESFHGSVVFSVESEGRRETLQDLLARIKLSPTLITTLSQAANPGHYLMVGASERGFLDTDKQLALICESDLLGERVSRRRQDNRRTINTDTLIRNLAELRPGQPVVHLEHGVGRYLGLTTLEAGGIKAEYLILTYAGEDKLYVPVSSLHLISRYSGGADDNAPLHRLGSDVWSRARQKAAEKVRDVAAELLDIYAQRAVKSGFKFKHDREQYQLFCQSFPFETTPDQEQAINAVLSDMCQPLAMDRLVCGDVGFGKTEVAMRAAFLAVTNNKQVAVLVPTTLLAQQHFDNFRDRFATWPVRIEMLSRFRSAKEQQVILEQAAEGKIDILIGTHKLLQSDLHWHDLGLLIVDEEHRFGVRHKERIKAMRADVDILTLTATPIPRTLNMAMSGMRDLSIIATPPARRLAVKTFVREYDSLVIREAILREILRGGQVYYLYNDVENIEKVTQKLAELVPEARIAIGHGQMRERDLERVMNDFHHQRFNVLVCTTIIETGIDIPSANTIIIERADHLGLAQLHQLRGRVGRSHHQAYAYLLTPNPKAMSTDAKKRLEAIASLEDLGAGFALATHDLEIRGAGELLGEDQSGQMTTIGFSLYMELLESAVDALKEGREPSLEDLTSNQTEIEMRMPVLLPEDFISDVNIRLSFYKRIASARNETELDELKVELIDRFGKLPDPARYLLHTAELRQQAQKLGIKRIEGNERGGFIEFGENNKVDPVYLIGLLQRQPQIYRLEGPTKLKFMQDLSDRAQRLKFITELLAAFAQHRIA
ncbi:MULTISPECIES: transcription-repair coupling factor [Yersinia pseudotuberculosis complex]|uniref:Transcription-repair-coupling factor n=1 Tax=Yersinia pseudotuberculosis serotype O:1b (strain IP 31758) TaxID=349747 RepID=A0A0U1QY74_YERP3|nr:MULTISPECIES: transcription-repair coupling factor [Yersinia pseudotuberculosis complex]ABS47649.1 transcription-repair coupling factor [Yersinia pseudotuberculosis IP 31758]AJJ70524.1 transcription-repair coupling factor [Yersinia pseudotuberculosis]AJK14748.1 transcription-repair coupling factor [Yersinia pseudotuberculosis str. PA3606]MCE4111270.1 transcription-repair coupling factor [Yersinia pseudotuberculosis]PSH16098.1 transcription-repair coupling factor [Yersinia pseudotuberculosis